jgi:hypothetical protein
MTKGRALKHLAAGSGIHIMFMTLFSMTGLGRVSETVDWPWLLARNWLFSSGTAGHAMPGGAMLGFVVGIVAYSVIIGGAVNYLRQMFCESESYGI